MGGGSWATAAAAATGAPSGFSLLSSAPSATGRHWELDVLTARPETPLATVLGGRGRDGAGFYLSRGYFDSLMGGALWALNPVLWWARRGSWDIPAATPRRQLVAEAVQLVELEALLRSPGDQQLGEMESGTQGVGSPRRVSPSSEVDERAMMAEAAAVCHDIAADQWRVSIRLMGVLLTRLWRALYGGRVLVGAEGLARLVDVAQERTIIYIPTHKSHLDYLLLSYALFCVGLQSPITAAGVNLNIPFVGTVCRWFGAFYISRSTRGQSSSDAELYRKVLRAYVHALLLNGLPVEFFIEGGRARDGRIATPRLGLLSTVLDAHLDLPLPRPLAIVPVSISYDVPLEEPAMVQQLLGRPKKKETLFGFANAFFDVLKGIMGSGSRGMAVLSFGQPLFPEEFIESGGRAAPKGKAKKKKQREKKVNGSSGGTAPPADDTTVAKQQAGRGDGKATLAAHRKAIMEREAMHPRGGELRRKATSMLGGSVVERLRAANVVPQLALVVAAAVMPPAVCGTAAPSASEIGGSEPGSWDVEARPRGVTARELLGRCGWLLRELKWRGQAAVALGGPGQSRSERLEAVLRAVALVPDCLEVQRAHAQGGSGNKVVNTKVRLQTGLLARCMAQSRLNYLLPAFAAEGLVVAALHAETRRARRAPSSPATGTKQTRKKAQTSGVVYTRPTAECSVPIPVEAVLESAAWLRLLLADELDCHLGQAELREPAAFRPVVARMLAEGGLAEAPLPFAPAFNPSKAAKGLILSPPCSSQQAALLAGWLLRPFCTTAAFVLFEVARQLEAAEGGRLTQAELLEGVKDGLLQEERAGSAVPSVVVAQSCMVGLFLTGVLVPVVEAAGCNGSHTYPKGRLLPRVETDNWALVERGKSGAPPSQVIEALIRKADSVLMLSDEYVGNAAAVSGLYSRLLSFSVL